MPIILSIFNFDRRSWKKVLGCICVLVFVSILLTNTCGILENKASYNHYQAFFENADDIDVLFFGSSHMENAILPMELWGDYGITSYNLGSSACTIPNAYWVMINALDYAKPEVVVIDCFAMDGLRKTTYAHGLVHKTLDEFRLSENKIRAVYDLLDDPEVEKSIAEGDSLYDTGEKRTPIGLLWDYSVYHSRWNELSEEDFDPEGSVQFGADSSCSVYEAPEYINNNGQIIEGTPAGVVYLTRMIEACRDRDIQVILTFIPYFYTQKDFWKAVNTAPIFAERYGVDYVDIADGSLCEINPHTDYADAGGHLNPSGAWKITEYFGKYLRERYNVQDHRKEVGYTKWEDAYARYSTMKVDRLEEVEDLDTFLMLLEDKNMGYRMYVPDKDLLEDKVLYSFLEQKAKRVGDIENLVITESSESEKGLIRIDVFNYKDNQSILFSTNFEAMEMGYKKVIDE